MNNDELVTRRAQEIAEDRCFSKGRLRDEFRMKPAPVLSQLSGIKTLMVAGSLYTELQIVFTYRKLKNQTIPLSTPYAT